MPSAPKTTPEEIVKAARKLVEARGRDGFSMNDVADAVGVRAPSLYGRFKDRAELLTAVERDTLHDFERVVVRACGDSDPNRALTAMAHTYRKFAKANPQAYALVFDAHAESTAEAANARAAALAPAMPAFAKLAGESNALLAARVLTPFLHGFVSMELASAFRLGGGINTAFEHGVATILAGLKKRK